MNLFFISSERVIGDTKVVTDYIINADGKKTKIVRTFKVVRKMVPKAIAQRKKWEKFGMSRNDRPGPDPSTTVVTDEISMQVKSSLKQSTFRPRKLN